ncbi:MAG: hypothetical protein NTW59_01290 [Candidatus Diapherotrites archaeon]|nr:hypothetical protein [Candidatus Diapherotrites archaeon]
MECKKAANEKQCPCPETSCKRHGVCCECVRYHRNSGDRPACLR